MFCAWPLPRAANPDKPPFYLDMPFAIVDGEAQIVPEVADKINAADPRTRVGAGTWTSRCG